MYCGNNKTALSSQRQISETMMEMLEEEPYDRITISALCKAAGISRQTFYSLFTSRENVVVFTLQSGYSFTLNEDMLNRENGIDNNSCGVSGKTYRTETREESGGLRMLCRIYSEYIEENSSFLRLLAKNNIDYLLYDSIYDALSDCGCFLAHADQCTRQYGAAFYAGGISSVARCYARQGCDATTDELEDMLYTFFTGGLF